MNNFDSFRGITRRHFWDAYRSPLTCVAFPTSSASASGQTIDISVQPVVQRPGPVLSATLAGGAVTLMWTNDINAYAAVLYRSNVIGGPFSIVAAGIIGGSFIDNPPGPGTFYYRSTLIESSFGETEVSNVVSITV